MRNNPTPSSPPRPEAAAAGLCMAALLLLPLLLSPSYVPGVRSMAMSRASVRSTSLLAASPRAGAPPLATSSSPSQEGKENSRSSRALSSSSASSLAYRALGPVVLVAVAASAIVLFTALLAPLQGPVAGGVKLVFAGAVAGVISRTCCAPLEMVSTIMMCRGDQCGSMTEELKKAWAADGFQGLFKGNGANCLKVAPSRGTQVRGQAREGGGGSRPTRPGMLRAAVPPPRGVHDRTLSAQPIHAPHRSSLGSPQFLVYEFVKRRLAAGVATGATLSAGQRLFAGGIAGMVAALIVYPLEVIKVRLARPSTPDAHWCPRLAGAQHSIPPRHRPDDAHCLPG
eukprot:scaffold113491_cov27-Tisochrysis_lutea.AAC.1